MRKWGLAILVCILTLSCTLTTFAAPAPADKNTGVGAEVSRSVKVSISDDYSYAVSYDDPKHPQIDITWQILVEQAVLYPGEKLQVELSFMDSFQGEETGKRLAFTTDYAPVQADGSQEGERFPLTLRLDGSKWGKVNADLYTTSVTLHTSVLDENGNPVEEGADTVYTISFVKDDIQVDQKPDDSNKPDDSSRPDTSTSDSTSQLPDDNRPNDSSRPTGGSGDSHKTGDTASVLSVLGLAALSSAILLAIGRGKRK